MNALQKTLNPYSTVVLTGGSSGIGRSFIEAIQGLNPTAFICNLSRSSPEKKLLSERVRHIKCDLEKRDAVQTLLPILEPWLEERLSAGKLLLINNSGFGSFGPFPEPNLGHQLGMVDLNVRAVVELTGALQPYLERQGGAVINVASTAAFQPTPYLATYAATKAFVLHWSLALHTDWRSKGIQVMALCPGPTESRFFARAGFSQAPNAVRGQTAPQVVEEALRALGKGRSLCVTGGTNRLLAAVSSRLPKALQAPVAQWAIRRSGIVERSEAQKRTQ
ncbi:MAG: SDR family NAD(P)-dependent oxidoreductase [Verrucomicrobiota bacterium JB022]|nr:SDR family NAD(P)-dependent oxidoreductase [Verrucomicrobiota bacterium JB022]